MKEWNENCKYVYEGKWMGVAQLKCRVSSEYLEFVEYGSTSDIVNKRIGRTGMEQGFPKGFTNGAIAFYKWSNSKEEYVYQFTYSY